MLQIGQNRRFDKTLSDVHAATGSLRIEQEVSVAHNGGGAYSPDRTGFFKTLFLLLQDVYIVVSKTFIILFFLHMVKTLMFRDFFEQVLYLVQVHLLWLV